MKKLVLTMIFFGLVPNAWAIDECQPYTVGGYADPCPVLNVDDRTFVDQPFEVELTPSSDYHYILSTVYILNSNEWQPYRFDVNEDWITEQTLNTLDPQALNLNPGFFYMVSWDWIWDAEDGCYKGAGLNQCDAGQWRITTFEIEQEPIAEPPEPDEEDESDNATTKYYVDCNRSSGSGSSSSPYPNISDAMNRAGADTTIYVRGTCDADVRIENKQGNANGYITLKRWGSSPAIIDGEFEETHGVFIMESQYIRIKGFEIRNIKSDGSPITHGVYIGRSENIMIEENEVHHVIGSQLTGGNYSLGIRSFNNNHVTIRHNTVHDIVGHGESMGIKTSNARNHKIQNNLIYFVDKEGIRLRSRDTSNDTNNYVEGNISLHANTPISVNYSLPSSRSTFVRNNFVGWGGQNGIQNKHTTNSVIEHNTIVFAAEENIDLHGVGDGSEADNFDPIIRNNIMAYGVESLYITDTFDEIVDNNLYYQTINNSDAARGGIEANPGFQNMENGNFLPGSVAIDNASDGRDIGAMEESYVVNGHTVVGCTQVGHLKQYGLRNIPMMLHDFDFNTIRIEDASHSGAERVLDNNLHTEWQPNEHSDITIDLGSSVPITHLYIQKDSSNVTNPFHYRDFDVYIDNRRISDPEGHAFEGYQYRYSNGEWWSLPQETQGREVRIEFNGNHSSSESSIKIPEIRFYHVE